MAHRAEDISVLENMHISKTFKLMRSAQSSVLQFKLSSCTGAVMVVAFCAWCRTRLRTYWPLSLEDVEFAARGNFNADLARAQDGLKHDHRTRLRKEMVEAF